ncbi:phage tail protein [Candidatus Symbiopectobacterium sp. NZEC127]|uniref:immunoglobulin domain-containing protein n=1 Tax=Candidatus Symbiopectobacterium sp. NZEC127 TaxID=2820472 RepID=UPI002227BAAE|nr:phage tail protein [Candidatus Symbiopectobacterium sp. NZEC127]MCW2485938.1 phage tail protein [Candidatus Symbiopectobacterium sp. NZEC127]
MTALYEKSQKTVIRISSAPTTLEGINTATFLELSCTIKEIQFTAGQKNDIDVTALCSDETENINGLPAPSEISLSGNFYRNAAQDALRDAYDNDTRYAFQVIFPSGNGFQFLSEVRQHTWSATTNSAVAATFSLRLKGKPTNIVPGPLVLTTNLPATKTVAEGAALTMAVAASGGIAPYSYKWLKDGSAISGRISASFNKATAESGDAGVYTCEVTDSAPSPVTITSASCTVTIS